MTLLELLQNDFKAFLSTESATAPLLKRVLLFLEDSEFTQADAYCEKVLDIDPENSLAYLGKLMASRRFSSLQDLANSQYAVDNDSCYKKAFRFAPEQMQQHLHTLNMEIYTNCIAACRNRARIHLAHGELNETAQQYHNAKKLWEDSKETLPNADSIYVSLSNEVADFNWKLLLHHRQCPDDQQLIDRSIPINNERWYLNALQCADDEKKAYFESVATQALFNAHIKCINAINTQQTRLARIWADHYREAAGEGDPLPEIHQTLIETDGYTRFVEKAPAAMLQLIAHYGQSDPRAQEIKTILQDYYVKIFQSILDFTGLEANTPILQPQLNEDRYEQYITEQEAHASNPGSAPAAVAETSIDEECTYTDPVWATETALQITQQMTEAVASELSPYGLLSTYLVAAKELTVRYTKKDGIVTDPLLFRFICSYYNNAITQAQPDQIAPIQTKFNDFLIDTVRLPSASAEIVAEASAHMQNSNLPYQIYLSRITNNYSAKQEDLISPQIVEDVEKWQRYLDSAQPKRDCYWLSDQQENISMVLVAAENAIDVCRQYPAQLQKNLDAAYREIIDIAIEGQEELTSTWTQKMDALQNQCDEWADALQKKLEKLQQVNQDKLQLALKHIKFKEAMHLTLSIAGEVLLLLAVLALALPLVPSLSFAWSTAKLPVSLAGTSLYLFYGFCIGVPVIAGALSLLNSWASQAYAKQRCRKLLWLFTIFSALIYGALGAFEKLFLLDGSNFPSVILATPDYIFIGAFALLGIFRALLEYFFSKLGEATRSRATQITCKIGIITAGVLGLVQALACFCLAGLHIYSLIIR